MDTIRLVINGVDHVVQAPRYMISENNRLAYVIFQNYGTFLVGHDGDNAVMRYYRPEEINTVISSYWTSHFRPCTLTEFDQVVRHALGRFVELACRIQNHQQNGN